MISSQLGRAVLSSPERSADEQAAAPDDRGGYGELMEALDRITREDGDPAGMPFPPGGDETLEAGTRPA